ncbi:MAG: WD40 repeat domain-containing protein [Myxococcales bacterium]|jgi:hypothetical protein
MNNRSLISPSIQTHNAVRDLLATPAGLLAQHDDAARLYEAKTGRLIRQLDSGPLGHCCRSLALLPDEKSVVLVTSSRIARFDLQSGEELASAPLEAGRGVAVSPDGKLAFTTARRDDATRLLSWSSDDGELTELVELGKCREVLGLAMEPDGRHLWLSVSTGLCRLDLRTKELWRSPCDREGRLAQPVVLATAAMVAVGTRTDSVQLWNTRQPELIGEVKLGAAVPYSVPVASLRKGRYFAAGDVGQRVFIFAPGEQAPCAEISGPRSAISALAADGEDGLWIGADDGTIWTVAVEDALLVLSHGAQAPASAKAAALPVHPTSHVIAVASVDSERAVSADLDGAVLSWRRGADVAVAAKKARASRSGTSTYAIPSIGVAGDHVVVRDGTAAFIALDADTLQRKAKLPHKGALLAVGAGNGVVTAGGKTLKRWSPETWEQTAEVVGPGGNIEALQYLPACGAVFARDERSVGLFEAADLKPMTRRSFAGIERLTASAVDPSGKHVALGFDDKAKKPRVRIWPVGALDLLSLDVEARNPVFAAGGLMVIDGDQLALYELDGKQRWSKPTSELLDVPAVSIAATDGERVALVGGGWLIVIEGASGNVVQRHVIDQQFLQVQFAGKELVCTTSGGRVMWLKAELGA